MPQCDFDKVESKNTSGDLLLLTDIHSTLQNISQGTFSSRKKERSVPHPDVFWAYRFLEIKDWIV